MAKDLGLEFVSQTNGSLGNRLLFLFRLSLWGSDLSIASASAASVEVSAILARSDRNFRDDVLILSLGGRRTYVSNVASTCRKRNVNVLVPAMIKKRRRVAV